MIAFKTLIPALLICKKIEADNMISNRKNYNTKIKDFSTRCRIALLKGGMTMKCLSCGVQFSPCDILVMEDFELPVCASCNAEEYHFQVDYDGSEDFNVFLEKEIIKHNMICNTCISGHYELVSMKFGNPVKVAVICSACKAKDKMVIYIRFV